MALSSRQEVAIKVVWVMLLEDRYMSLRKMGSKVQQSSACFRSASAVLIDARLCDGVAAWLGRL